MRLPEKDTHFKDDQYQLGPFLESMAYVKDFSQAIDIGAHVGFWAKNMKTRFKEVYCFEPVKENFDCLIENVPGIKAYNVALGRSSGFGDMVTPKESNSGAWELREGLGTTICTLDSYNLSPSFIKIDVQGSELDVLIGGKDTIMTHKPTIIIEVIMNNVFDIEIIRILKKYGLTYRKMVGKNIIVSA